MRVTVELTEQDINTGETGDCYYCPIAVALRRMGIQSSVYNYGIILLNVGLPTQIEICETLQQWIRDFDAHRAVEPICFELDIPKSAIILPRHY